MKLLIDENYNSERISTHCVWYAALSERIFLTKVMKKVIVMVLDMPIILTKHFWSQHSQGDQVRRGTLSFEKNRYRLIILRKSHFVDPFVEKIDSFFLEKFSTHQYCLEFSFTFSDKSVNKGNFLKIINLYCPSFCSYSKVLV